MSDDDHAHASLAEEVTALRRRVRELEAAQTALALERQGTEEALRESELRFRSLVEATSDWIWEVDAQGVYTYASPKVADLLGYTPQEVIGKTPFDLMPPEEASRVTSLWKSTVAAAQPFTRLENLNRHKDGHTVLLETSGVPVLDAAGQLRGYRGIDRDVTERKQAEEALHKEFTFRNAIIECAAEGLCVCHEISGHPHVAFTVWNRRMTEITGYSMAEINRRGWYQTVYPDPEQQARAQARMARMREGEDLQGEEWEITRSDGTRRLIRISTSVVRKGAGETHVLALMQDVTAGKQAEEALRESEERYRQLFELESDAIVLVDHATDQVLEVNAAAVALYGYSREEWCRLKTTDLSAEPDKAQPASHESYSYLHLRWHRKKDGSVFPVEITGCSFERRGGRVHVAAIRDISARKQMEERIGKLNRLKARLLGVGTLPEKLKLISDGVVEIFGADFARVWITRPGDLCEKGCPHASLPEGPGFCADRSRCLHLLTSSGRYTSVEGSHRRVPLGAYKVGRIASGQEQAFVTNDVTHDPQVHNHEWARSLDLVSFAGFRLVSPEDQPVGVLALFSRGTMTASEEGLLQDLAHTTSQAIIGGVAEEERRNLEARMQQAQKLESLGVMAGGIAHDFNNLLTAILGHADLALGDLPPESPARESLREIEQASRRAAELCRQMLAYSGRGRFSIEPIHLSRLVHEITHLLQVSISRKAALRCQLPEQLPLIDADAAQVRQVVMNLVINAAEAIGDRDGLIAVATGVVDCDAASLRASHLVDPPPPGRFVFLEVRDSGCGMEAAVRSRIFDPFFTTKFTGRGLGLAAVLGIVRGHKGAIHVESEPGRGTLFRVLFPASRRVAPFAEPEAAPAPWRGSGAILLVDDEEQVRAVATKMLERCGFRVVAARDGQEAVRIFAEQGGEITCVLLDLTMPRMDGEAAWRELRRLRPDVRVILASGYTESDIARRFGDQGPAAFLEKPYQMSVLSSKLRQVLAPPPG